MLKTIPVMALVSTFLFFFTTSSFAAQEISLPARGGERPQTTNGVPHYQISAFAQPELSSELLRRVGALTGVEVRETVISLPGAKGFWILESVKLIRPDAIVGGREFAHLHPDGSLHASLSPTVAKIAIEAGWAIMHPWANQRAGWEGFVMIYTPISEAELEIVFQLVQSSYNFVTGRS